jgi:hypothetical protein
MDNNLPYIDIIPDNEYCQGEHYKCLDENIKGQITKDL